jgi:starch synthase (maltosyl-transferring)
MRPFAIDPADARKITVWGDLAEIDNEASSDLDGLYAYWRKLIKQSIELGFEGFRCDAAYKVPSELWRSLRQEARQASPNTLFCAETLGCRLQEVASLKEAGFDYLFNSSKYWNFDKAWAIEQHEQFGAIAPSISFPESHDTPRLMQDCQGNLAVMRQRYFLAAIFSKGLLMPMGYEFAFKRQMHVVNSTPQDWEETGLDLRSYIGAVNKLKHQMPLLQQEGHLTVLSPYDQATLLLRKENDQHDNFLLAAINKDWHAAQTIDIEQSLLVNGLKCLRIAPDGKRSEQLAAKSLRLEPAEIALLTYA